MNRLLSLFTKSQSTAGRNVFNWCKTYKWNIITGVPCATWLYNDVREYRGKIEVEEPKVLHRGYVLQAKTETKIFGIPIIFDFTQRHEFENPDTHLDFEKNKDAFAQLCINQHEFKKYCIYESKHPLVCAVRLLWRNGTGK